VVTEIPELGLGIESADSPVCRTAYQLYVRKEKQNGVGPKLTIPALFLCYRHWCNRHNIPLYSRGRVWTVPTKKAISTMFYLPCKKFKKDI